jgi:F-type H+-transporting ATPase subunit b
MVEATQQASGLAGAAGALGLNLKLFIAQLVNFGVVLFVMWKWVYTPLLKVMDERTRKIEQGLKDAETAATSRAAADAEREKTIVAARTEAKRIIEEAATAAETERQASVARAKGEVERIVAQGKERLAQEHDALIAGIRAEAADLVAAAAEKVLRQKLDAAGDAKLVKDALKDLA